MRGANPTFVLCYPALPPQDWNRWKSQALGEIWIQVLLVMRLVLYLGAATIFRVPSLDCIITTSSVFVWISFLPQFWEDDWIYLEVADIEPDVRVRRFINYAIATSPISKSECTWKAYTQRGFFWPNLSLQRTSWRSSSESSEWWAFSHLEMTQMLRAKVKDWESLEKCKKKHQAFKSSHLRPQYYFEARFNTDVAD